MMCVSAGKCEGEIAWRRCEGIGSRALKPGKSISKDETKSLVMSMGHRLTAVIVRKGSATK